MTNDYAKWTAICWLQNGRELDIAYMHRSLRKLGVRIAHWSYSQDPKCFFLSLDSERPVTEVIEAVVAWIEKEWIWPGQHLIHVTGASGTWLAPIYDIDVTRQHDVTTYEINEKVPF